MRKDAERNRQKLIDAAREMMRNEGGDVPMELIVERAQLTRGTLYRNFPHRQAMYEAVLQDDLETITKEFSEADDNPLAFIRTMAELIMVYDKFLISLVKMEDYDAETNQARIAAIISAPLSRAQALGVLHTRLTTDDILMACRMLASHWRLDNISDRSRSLDLRLNLMMAGLGADRPDHRVGPSPSEREAAFN
jgi:AcrR family transcriptional regulator